MQGQPRASREPSRLIAPAIRSFASQWWRFALLQLLALLGVTLLIGAIAVALQSSSEGLLGFLSSDLERMESRLVWVAMALVLGVVVISLPFLIAAISAIAALTGAALSEHRLGLWRALGRGFERFLPMLGALALAAAAVVLALVAAPFVVLAGLVGLAVAGIRRRPAGVRVWGFVSIPFAVAGRLAAAAAFVVPAAVFAPGNPWAVCRAADAAAQGRRWRVAGAMIPAFALSVGVAVGGTLLGQLIAGELGAALIGTFLQLLAMPLPIVVAVVLYREAAGPGRISAIPAPGPARGTEPGTRVSPRLARTALGTAVALILSTAVVPLVPVAAEASPGAAYTVTSSADTLDEGELAAQRGSCEAAGAECTIRAALQLAQTAAEEGATGASIGFSGAMTIELVGALNFAPAGSEAVVNGAVLDIGGEGQGVILDAGQASQVLYATSEFWNLRIAGLTMRNGWAAMGGAVLAGVNQTIIEGAIFEGNTATMSGGAVFGRDIVVARSAFIDNRATYYNSNVKGGALQASGDLTIENSTFSGNEVGDGISWQFTNNQGGDAYSAGALSVRNATFVNYVGGSLRSDGGGNVVNSVFTTDSTQGGAACTGSFAGGQNVTRLSDTTCPGTNVPRITHPVIGSLDRDGVVPVFPLSTANGVNPAFGAGTDCPAVDALGKSRPEQGCDLGAVETDGRTSLALTTHPDPEVFGTVVLRATVSSVSGGTPSGSVVFTVDGVPQAAAALADVLGEPGVARAELEVGGLDRSAPHPVSAQYQPTGVFVASADSLSYSVPQLQRPVTLNCVDPESHTTSGCTNAHWRIADSASIELLAGVDDPGVAGAVYLAHDAEGEDPATAVAEVEDGAAGFTLQGDDLGLGEHDLYAIYESHDEQHSGVSAPRTVTVLRTPTVTISMAESSGVYGDPVAGRATVTVSGPEGAPVPTGTVSVRGESATLDEHGEATLDLSLLGVGLGHQDLRAGYDGDEHFAIASSNATGYQTSAAATITSITGTMPAEATFGEAIAVTVEVRAQAPSTFDPIGDVTLTVGPDGGDPRSFGPVTTDLDGAGRIGASTVQIEIPAGALAAGSHELVASFAPSVNTLASTSASRTIDLAKAGGDIALSVQPSTAAIGRQVTLEATATAPSIGEATGQTVAFLADGQELGTAPLASACADPGPDCAVATLTVEAAAIGLGDVRLTAVLVESGDYTSATSTDVPLTVTKATPTVRLTAPESIVYGDDGTVSIQLDDSGFRPADGSLLTITATSGDDTPIVLGTVSLANGLGYLPLAAAGLPPGDYVLTATFAGDESFAAASETSPLTVTAVATRTTWDPSGVPFSATYGAPFDVPVTVANLANGLRPEGDVVLLWNGVELGRETLGSVHDAESAGTRTVTVRGAFTAAQAVPTDGRLTAAFEAATGFAASKLSESAPDDRVLLTLTPIPVTVSVQMSAVLGQNLEATASVAAGAAELGIVPQGWVTFTLNKSGYGLEDIGPVALVDGQITLADALAAYPSDTVLVNLAGTWSVRATFTPAATERRVVAEPPGSTDLASATITAGTAAVIATAPASTELGQTLTVSTRVEGTVTPTGKVRVERFANPGYFSVSDEVTLVDGQAEIPLNTSLGLGEQRLRVHYLGDSALEAADSDLFAVTVGKASSAVVVTSANSPYTGIVGAKVGYTATVSSAFGAPTGTVTFMRGESQLGQLALTANPGGQTASASILITAGEAWSGDIVARFTSGEGDVADGEGALAHSWVLAPVILNLNTPPFGVIGSPNTTYVTAQLDWTQFQFLSPSLRPAAPSGTVTVSDGAGSSCVVALVDQGGELSSGNCALAFAGLGTRTVTASYAGDISYAAAVSDPMTTSVAQGTPQLTLTTPSETWPGLGTIPVSWSVAGPTDGGTVTVLRGTETVCTSSSTSGSCDVAIPAFDRSQYGGRITLQYSGSTLWLPRETTMDGTINACVPFMEPQPQPAGSATVTVSPEQTTCGSGESAGYYLSDRVSFSAQPSSGYRVTGFVGAPVGEYGATFPYDPANISFGTNGSAWMLASPELFLVNEVQVPFTASPIAKAECVSVDIEVFGLPKGTDSLNSVYWDTNGQCAPTTKALDSTTWRISVESGSKLKMGYQSAFMPPRTKFYGWQGDFEGSPFDQRVSYTVSPENRKIHAVFGPVCYSGLPRVTQPSDGAIEVNISNPNCTDPQTKEKGWTWGAIGMVTLRDQVGQSLEVVSRDYLSQGGSMRWVEQRGWVAQKPVFFDGWSGDTSRITDVSSSTSADEAGVRRTSRTVSFKVSDQSFALGAKYGRCTTLSAEVIGDGSEGPPGTVTMNTAANCPLGTGFNGERWYRSGTQVSLSTQAKGKSLRFLAWGGLPSTVKHTDSAVSFALDQDVQAVAAYGTNANCRPFSLTTVPAGSLKLDTRFSLGPNACEALYGKKFYDQGVSGNGILIDAAPATADAQGAEIVFAWSSNELGSGAGSVEGVSSVWQRTNQLNEGLYGNSTIVAYACEFVDIQAAVSGPSGGIVPGAGATNLVRGSLLDDFLTTQRADCATGSDPKSGYAGYAWTVGTELTPLVTADPVAYRFTGWSGDVAGKGESPDQALRLVGPGRTAEGGNYHYRVVANFQAICYTLSLPSDADKLEVLTAPNCPGVDASKRMYLGGTVVVLHAADKGDTLFRHWVSGTDQIDEDQHWASVVMTSDKTVVPYYSAKSAGEQLSSYGALVGDAMAIASKKMIGVASAAVAAYAKVLLSKVTLVAQGIGYVAQGLEYMGVHGVGIDAMKTGAAAMENMIALIWAPLDCLTAWSAGGENTAVFAAQNAIGTAIVSALSAGAQQQTQETGDSTLAKLKAQAKEAKDAAQPAVQAMQAITAAKQIYEAGAAGDIGIETSAYEAWGSQASLAVFSTCMSGRAEATIGSVLAVGR